jgi:hypothetical protein
MPLEGLQLLTYIGGIAVLKRGTGNGTQTFASAPSGGRL